MLQILTLIVLLSPLIFQFTYGRRAIHKNISMTFGKVALISFSAQILFSIASFAFGSYNFSKYFDEHPNQTRCGMPLAALLFGLLFLIAVLIALILLQFIIKIWKEHRAKSKVV